MIRSNAKELMNKLAMASKKLNAATIASHRGAAVQGVYFAQRIAPVKTGDLKRGIYRRSFKFRSQIYSRVNKSFPYNQWVNENIKTVILNGRKRTYRSCKITGMPGYFTETFKFLTVKVPFEVRISVRRALMTSFNR